jgi:Chalcone isomerase-like
MPRVPGLSRFLWRALIIYGIIAPVWSVAKAAELDGVQLPDTLQIDGKSLHLNGFGLRTFSVLGIHIYVASLYLEHSSADPEAIIRSPDTKLLIVRFERSVSADEARKAWRDGLENNCIAPCRLDPEDVERFLAMVPAMHEGDNYSMLFTQHRAIVTVSGHQIGTISQPHFADAMLATFLGPNPASPRLKRALLQGHE